VTVPLRRDEALALLPLLAAGDLEPGEAERLRAAVASDPSLAPEAARLESVHALLARTLGRPRAAVQVRRRCPFCHDAIEAEALVVCATCATPHHATCFGQHGRCSLLGCGGAQAIGAHGPRARACTACEQITPDAPFCAWCGAALEVAEVRLPWWSSTRRYAAAAALVLTLGLGVGVGLGAQQRTLIRAHERSRLRAEERNLERNLAILPEVLRAFRERDGDKDDLPDDAGSWDELSDFSWPLEGERPDWAAVWEVGYSPWFEATFHRPRPDAPPTVVVLPRRERTDELGVDVLAFVLPPGGVVEVLPRGTQAVTLDQETGTVVECELWPREPRVTWVQSSFRPPLSTPAARATAYAWEQQAYDHPRALASRPQAAPPAELPATLVAGQPAPGQSWVWAGRARDGTDTVVVLPLDLASSCSPMGLALDPATRLLPRGARTIRVDPATGRVVHASLRGDGPSVTWWSPPATGAR